MIQPASVDRPDDRPPTDSAIRDRIVDAANEHFRHYGYGKTTMADLARQIGFSKAYLYRFFESKQAIGEEICSQRLDTVLASVTKGMEGGKSASDKFRRLCKRISEECCALFFEDRKLYDIAATSASENWSSNVRYQEQVLALIEGILRAGRDSGEFERKTPLDETCRAIFHVMQPFMNPLMLQYNLDNLPDAANEVSSLVLRSLAP